MRAPQKYMYRLLWKVFSAMISVRRHLFIMNLTVVTMLALLFPIPLYSPASFGATAALSSSSSQQVEWHVNVIDSCKNRSFCGTEQALSEKGTARGLSSGTILVTLRAEEWFSTGQVAFTENGTITGTWTTGSTGDFVVTGIETLTVVTSSGTTTTRTQWTGLDLGIPVKTVSLTCQQIYGTACPSGVKASETITETH